MTAPIFPWGESRNIEVLGQSVDELTPPSRALWGEINKMVREQTEKEGLPPDQFFFNRRMIREKKKGVSPVRNF